MSSTTEPTGPDFVPDINRHGYEKLYYLENGLREVVLRCLENDVGAKWWKQRVPPDLREKADDGKAYELSQPWRTRAIHHHIYYLDFPQLRQIIAVKNNWDETFKEVFLKKDEVLATLSAVEPVRNRLAHTRKLLDADVAALDRAINMLESCVGEKTLAEYLAAPTVLPNGKTLLADYWSQLTACVEDLRQLRHVKPTDLPPQPAYWLLEQAYGAPVADRITELDQSLQGCAQLHPGPGSALVLRNLPERLTVLEIFGELQAVPGGLEDES